MKHRLIACLLFSSSAKNHRHPFVYAKVIVS